MKFCPTCHSEYRPGFDRCPDCNVALVAQLTAEKKPTPHWEKVDREVVFTTGRRIDAEMVRGMLEANGLDARIWGGGMGAYRLESAITEITGVPSPFNSYSVGVLLEQADEARSILANVEEESLEEHDEPDTRDGGGVMISMGARWALVVAALFLLVYVILFGPPRT